MQQDTFDSIPRPEWASSSQFPHHIWSDVQHEAKRLGFSLHKLTDQSVSYPDSEDWDRFSVTRTGDVDTRKIFTRPVQGQGVRGRGFTEAIQWMRTQKIQG